jgi:flagellar motility protein MotE (MotC chaperone)
MEELITSDMDLIVDILEAMTSEIRAGILAAMEPVNAAAVTKMLSPF